MASKYIDNSNYAISGYTLSGGFPSLTIGSAGLIGGVGIVGSTHEAYTIVNRGRVSGSSVGLSLSDGGTVTNASSGTITGVSDGVLISAGTAALTDAGTIQATGTRGIGVSIASDGIVSIAAGGIVAGYDAIRMGTGTLINAGLLEASGTYKSAAVYIASGGDIVNALGGRISGVEGIDIESGVGTVSNAGMISGIYLSGGEVINHVGGVIASGTFELTTSAILIGGSGSVINDGVIQGNVYIDSGGTHVIDNAIDGRIYGRVVISGMLTNSGTIEQRVSVADGSVINAANAFIADVAVLAPATVMNSGIIQASPGSADPGVSLTRGLVENLTTSSLIAGRVGVLTLKSGSTITNAGTIEGVTYGTGVGVVVDDGAVITNTNARALIEGANGVTINYGVVTNFGRIEATANNGIGVLLRSGGGTLTLTNAGSAALISGSIGVKLDGAATVENYGTIAGTAGIALEFAQTGGVLIDEAGSRFIGKVVGDGSTLELAGHVGTLNGLGTSFSGFGTFDVLAGADWVLNGGYHFGSNSIFSDSGTFRATGELTLDGNAELDGTLIATTLVAAGGLTLLGADQGIAASFVETGGLLALGVHVLDLTGAASFDGGEIEGSGRLATRGATTLAGSTLTGEGILATYGATSLTNFAVTGGSVWRNYGRVADAGALTLGDSGGGAGRLVTEANSDFYINGNDPIAIAAGGTGTIINSGLISKEAGKGFSDVAPGIDNAGTLAVYVGTLLMSGAVTGIGMDLIGETGTLQFAGSVAAGQTIDFAATAGGELALDDRSGSSLSFAGTVKGFGGSDRLDIVSFTTGTASVKWTQNGSSGTLTVTDGSDAAKITLFGQYVQAGFKPTTGTGGTVITYTTPAQQTAALAAPHR